MSNAGIINSTAGSVPDATELVKGKARLATAAEALAGVNDTTIITPLKLSQVVGGLSKYSETDSNSTIGWSGPLGGYYYRIITAATHGRGLLPSTDTYEYDGVKSTQIIVDVLEMASNGDITIKVPDSPDLRFRAKIVIS